MPVNGTRVTTYYAYVNPGPPQTFSAKSAGAGDETGIVSHQQIRAWRSVGQMGARILLFLFGGT